MSNHPDADRIRQALNERLTKQKVVAIDEYTRELILRWFCEGWAARDQEVRMLKEELNRASKL